MKAQLFYKDIELELDGIEVNVLNRCIVRFKDRYPCNDRLKSYSIGVLECKECGAKYVFTHKDSLTRQAYIFGTVIWWSTLALFVAGGLYNLIKSFFN